LKPAVSPAISMHNTTALLHVGGTNID
jgi:hypothetical protein